MKVAIIGSGISGLAAAHRLRSRVRVTLFEAGRHFGGHTHTVDVTLPDERGQQITDWRREHQHTGPYVVIDDGGFRPSGQWTDLGISRSGHPVVFVSNVLALTLVDVEIAINVLTGS